MKQAKVSVLHICPHLFLHHKLFQGCGPSIGRINSFLGKKITKRRGVNSDYFKLVIFLKQSSPQIYKVYQMEVKLASEERPKRQESKPLPGRAGRAGEWSWQCAQEV